MYDDTRSDTRSVAVVSTDRTVGKLHEAARQAYRDSLDRGSPLTGKALGAMFGLSERWGQLRAAEVRAEAASRRNGPNSSFGAVNGGRSAAGRRNGTAEPLGSGVVAPVRVATDEAADTAKADAVSAADTQSDVSPWVGRITVVAVVAVALAAARASFDHLAELARMAGEGHRARLLPVSVDGLVVAASMVLYRASKLRVSAGFVPWASLVLGLTASIVGNIVAVSPDVVDPTILRVMVAAWPPLALALSFELLLRQARHQ